MASGTAAGMVASRATRGNRFPCAGAAGAPSRACIMAGTSAIPRRFFMLRRLPLLFVVVVVGVLSVAVTVGAQPAAKAKTAVITLEKGGEITIEFFPGDAP